MMGESGKKSPKGASRGVGACNKNAELQVGLGCSFVVGSAGAVFF